MKNFSIIITTKNRLEALKFTLQTLERLVFRRDVDCIICDDGSNDGTYNYIQENYPNIKLIRNINSKGLIFSRNRMMNLVTTTYAISLDDDLSFLIEEPLEKIDLFFRTHKECAVLSFRIFWGINKPAQLETNQKSEIISSFAGGAHAIRMEAWKSVPKYPDWFVFYGEEDFLSYHLFLKNWKIYYLPEVLTHHRVDLKKRKKEKDYIQRTRRSLRSGWYLCIMFYPLRLIPKKLAYSLYIQLKNKVLKGDFKAFISIIFAVLDVFTNSFKLFKNSKRLTYKQYLLYKGIRPVPLYWNGDIKD